MPNAINTADLDPRLEIERTWQRVTDWDDVHALKLIHDHLTELQMMMLHRLYLLAIGEASLRDKKKLANGTARDTATES
jgi:hypothetical protein